jgi:4-hydroxy-tetrahydrodipicolinate synthase
MTGFSFPEVLRALRVFLEKGDRANAFATFARFLPLIAFEALPVVGLGIRKEILRRRGVIRCAVSRVGPAALNQSLLAELDEILEELAVETTSSPFEVD